MSLKEMLPNRDAFGNYTVSKTYGGSCAMYISNACTGTTPQAAKITQCGFGSQHLFWGFILFLRQFPKLWHIPNKPHSPCYLKPPTHGKGRDGTWPITQVVIRSLFGSGSSRCASSRCASSRTMATGLGSLKLCQMAFHTPKKRNIPLILLVPC